MHYLFLFSTYLFIGYFYLLLILFCHLIWFYLFSTYLITFYDLFNYLLLLPCTSTPTIS